ncbi:MAG: tetratricopeptide repeat protein [Myxococcales bacterium]|nr:tetratricopeptide repeat protein [Myxococcales bacterium]
MRHAWLSVFLLAFVSVAEAQTPDELAEARAAFAEGVTAYEAGDYDEAAERFARAHALTEDPDLAFNTARAYERAGERDEAVRYYRLYLRNSEASAWDRAELETFVTALESDEPPPAPPASPSEDGLRRNPSFAARFTPRYGELFRFSALFTMGFGGGLRFDAEPEIFLVPNGRRDLEATFGAAVRGEVFVARYLGIGAEVGLASYSVEDAEDRELTIDLDLWLRPRLPFVLSDTLEVEIYVGIPFGFTIYRPSGEDLENLLGFNAGFLGGMSFAVHQNLAVFAEVGWRHRQVYDEVEVLFEKRDITMRTDQAHVAVGVSLRL